MRVTLCLLAALAGSAADAASGSATASATVPVATAAAAPVAVEMSATPAQLAMGGTVTVTVAYRWPSAWSAGEPNPSLAFTEQFVTAAPPPVASSAGGEERRVFSLTLSPMRSGAWQLPRVAFAATPPEGEPRHVESNTVVVQVGPATSPVTPPDARPLAKRAARDDARSLVPWIAGGGVLVAGILALALLARRRRAAPPPDPLAELRAALALADGAADGKDAAAITGLALRRYAGAVWSFDGAGATAREATAAVRAVGPDDEARELARLLDALETVRWSPQALPRERLAPVVQSAGTWAESVRRRLDAEAEARRRAAAGAPAPAAPAEPGRGAA